MAVKEDKIEGYCKKNQLRANAQIKQFLRMRFSLLYRSYEQEMKKQEQVTSSERTVNFVFAQRFIKSEADLTKAIIDYLN